METFSRILAVCSLYTTFFVRVVFNACFNGLSQTGQVLHSLHDRASRRKPAKKCGRDESPNIALGSRHSQLSAR